MADEISVVVCLLVASTLSQPACKGPPTRRWLTPRRPPRCCLETSLPLVCKLLELSRHGISRYRENTEEKGLLARYSPYSDDNGTLSVPTVQPKSTALFRINRGDGQLRVRRASTALRRGPRCEVR